MKPASVVELAVQRERLSAPERGSLTVPTLNVAISWDADRCAVFVGSQECVIDELSGVSVQISTWQSPPEISWFGPDKSGTHWLGVEFFVSEGRGTPAGRGERVRLKAEISAEEAAALPRLELGKAEEVQPDELIEAVTAMRYHGAELSRGTEELRPEPQTQEQTSPWWQPVELTLLALGAAVLSLASMRLGIEGHSLAFPAGLAAASLGIHALVQKRRARTLERESGLPLGDPSFALFTAGTGFLVLASVIVPIGLSPIGVMGSAIFWVLAWSGAVWLSASELKRAAVRRTPPPEDVPERPEEGRWAIVFFFSHGGVPALLVIALSQTMSDWRPVLGSSLWVYMLARYLWVILKLSRQDIWPDWRGPTGTVDRNLVNTQAKSGNMGNPSISFHGLMLIRIGLILLPVGLALLALGSELDGSALFAVPVVAVAVLLFERVVIAEMKVETWDSIPFFGIGP